MKYFFFISISSLTFIAGLAQEQYSIHDLKSGKFKEDSSYIYSLPFENRKESFSIQAYESKMSHKGE